MPARIGFEKTLKIAAAISGIALAIVWAAYVAYIVPMGRSGLYYWGKILAPWMVSLGCVVVVVSVGAAVFSSRQVAFRTVAIAGGMTIAGLYWRWTDDRVTQETLEHNTLLALLASISLTAMSSWFSPKDWLHLSLRVVTPLAVTQVLFLPFLTSYAVGEIAVCLSVGFAASYLSNRAGTSRQVDE